MRRNSRPGKGTGEWAGCAVGITKSSLSGAVSRFGKRLYCPDRCCRGGRLSLTSQTCRKHSMGSVADRIARKLLSSRGSKVIDLESWREGRKMALEAGFGGEDPVPGKFADLDPCFAIYALAQNITSLMAESISGMREVKGFVRTVSNAEDEYLPSGPPMSPLTCSYFGMWAFFDVRFGSSRETMGSCILRIAPEFDLPFWLIDSIERMQQSRMGFYVHCGSQDTEVLLREVGTREIISCMVPAGYTGREGEIWFRARASSAPPRSPGRISCSSRHTSSRTIPNASSLTTWSANWCG